MKLTVPYEESKQLAAKLPCPNCGSSDALFIYTNGSECYSCETKIKGDGHAMLAEAIVDEVGEEVKRDRFATREHLDKHLTVGELHQLKSRGISKATCEKYGVTTLVQDGFVTGHVYPYFDREERDNHVFNKIRALPKEFRSEGKPGQAGLFGQQAFPPGSGRKITLTEGELDAMAAYQLQGSQYPCVSIIRGVASSLRDVKDNLEYLESFDDVYICFDADKKGRDMAPKVAALLSPGKGHVVHLDKKYKDANGYLLANMPELFVKTWWKAQVYTPAGIVTSSALKERIRNRPHKESIPYPWDSLNRLTYGIRKGEAVVIAGMPGVGKTAFIREILYHILESDPEAKIGTLFLEEIPETSGLGLMSINASIPFHLPDSEYTQGEYDEAEKVLDDDRTMFYDSFGSNRIEEIVNRVRYYVKGMDCGYVILDPLSIIVSDQQEGDERKLLDKIITQLKTLTIELDMALIVVTHLNRQGKIRSTAGIEMFANMVIRLDRDQENSSADVRSTLQVVITKNRFSGKTGPACALKYDEATGRLNEVELVLLQEFERVEDETGNDNQG